jgi:hypothetical protein
MTVRELLVENSGHYNRLKGAAAEAVVHELAQKSFFGDWCYANPRLANGKELCDLLVVFDRIAMIWQIKDLKRRRDGRYSSGEVEKNRRQLSGAHRRLMDEERPMTISNPRRGDEVIDPASIDEVFLISVLSGEGEDFFSMTQDVRGKYAHVLTGEFLATALEELDTVDDFVCYLRAKEALFDSVERLVITGGEEELLACYLLYGRSFDRYAGAHMVLVDEGSWAGLQERPEYIARREADEISYAWDGMIDRAHEGGAPEYERIARELARPNRFARRFLAKAFYDGHVIAHEDSVHDLFRRVVTDGEVTYCFLFMDARLPQEQRREALARLCLVARGKYEENSRVVGVATEKAFKPECSYDFAYLEIPEWSDANAAQAAAIQQETGDLTNISERVVREDEYPE